MQYDKPTDDGNKDNDQYDVKTTSSQTGCLNGTAGIRAENKVAVSKDVGYCNNLKNSRKRVVQLSRVRSSTAHRGILIRSRVKAGSDSPNNRCPRAQQQRQRALPRPVTHQPQPVVGRRLPVWGTEADRGLTPLRYAYRGNDSRRRQQPQQQQQRRRENPGSVGAAARPPSRIPVARKRAEQPSPCRRLDQPVEHYHGSKLPVPERRQPAPKRIRRPGRQHVQINDVTRLSGVPAVAQRPRGSDSGGVPSSPCTRRDPRRLTFDAEPVTAEERPGRRSTYDVPAPSVCPGRRSSNGSQPVENSRRRGTYDVTEPNVRHVARLNTYEIPQCPPNGRPAMRRDTYNVATPNVICEAATNSGGGRIFSVMGTFHMNNNGYYPTAGQHSVRDAVQDYIDNQMDEGVIAPREVAVPGTPYRHIDPMESNNTTPPSWREMMADRSSIEPGQAMSISSSDSRPFGMDDSFLMLPHRESASRRRHSRAATVDHECRPAPRCHRRDTFDRNTC